jgi:hypothetical protein
MSAANPNPIDLSSLKHQTYGSMIAPEVSVVAVMMRHIEPLLMSLGNLNAHVNAVLKNQETHRNTTQRIRVKMLAYTPETLQRFLVRLTRRIGRLNSTLQPHQYIPFAIAEIPHIDVLWQPLTIDPITNELCVDSSFNDKLIEVNAQITDAFLALNRLGNEDAPPPPV